MYAPPFTLTQKILNCCITISELLGYSNGIIAPEPQPRLRKENRIKTIHSTLAIEGNTLTLEQITALVEGKKIIGKKQEILEVQNTIEVYNRLDEWNPTSVASMLKAHKLLMTGLINKPGNWRNSDVGIIKGSQISHVAPPSSRVSILVHDIFEYLKKEKETHTFVKACVFHYELLFIHPFMDGNGRMARLWQQLILLNYHPVFRHVSIESLIKENQTEYYKTLEQSDRSGESTVFIEFMLHLVQLEIKALVSHLKYKKNTYKERIIKAKEEYKDSSFSRKDYVKLFGDISPATASRDLKKAVEEGYLAKEGDKATTCYKFL